VNELKRIRDAILEQFEKDPNKVVPIVMLDADSYPHKEYGKIHTPVLTIVDWATMGQNEYVSEEPEAEAEAEAEEAPRRRRRR
jgi:hypothetical protein